MNKPFASDAMNRHFLSRILAVFGLLLTALTLCVPTAMAIEIEDVHYLKPDNLDPDSNTLLIISVIARTEKCYLESLGIPDDYRLELSSPYFYDQAKGICRATVPPDGGCFIYTNSEGEKVIHLVHYHRVARTNIKNNYQKEYGCEYIEKIGRVTRNRDDASIRIIQEITEAFSNRLSSPSSSPLPVKQVKIELLTYEEKQSGIIRIPFQYIGKEYPEGHQRAGGSLEVNLNNDPPSVQTMIAFKETSEISQYGYYVSDPSKMLLGYIKNNRLVLRKQKIHKHALGYTPGKRNGSGCKRSPEFDDKVSTKLELFLACQSVIDKSSTTKLLALFKSSEKTIALCVKPKGPIHFGYDCESEKGVSLGDYLCNYLQENEPEFILQNNQALNVPVVKWEQAVENLWDKVVMEKFDYLNKMQNKPQPPLCESKELAELKEKNNYLQGRLESLKENEGKLLRTLQDHESKMVEYEEQIADLKNNHEQEIIDIELEAANDKEELEKKEKAISAQNDIISTLRNSVTALRKQLDEAESKQSSRQSITVGTQTDSQTQIPIPDNQSSRQGIDVGMQTDSQQTQMPGNQSSRQGIDVGMQTDIQIPLPPVICAHKTAASTDKITPVLPRKRRGAAIPVHSGELLSSEPQPSSGKPRKRQKKPTKDDSVLPPDSASVGLPFYYPHPSHPSHPFGCMPPFGPTHAAGPLLPPTYVWQNGFPGHPHMLDRRLPAPAHPPRVADPEVPHHGVRSDCGSQVFYPVLLDGDKIILQTFSPDSQKISPVRQPAPDTPVAGQSSASKKTQM
ncbi:hypothetical protein [Candidatus Sororendozoicomonas aggregata]|uniref:hypothetical protein n=1 Tax=Candidatus Sororendozoicomonas aggregata TaxID=3073239 RepID=UPI002ED110CE